jgi:nucleotide-binding universal stress UspA family protein
MRVLLGVDGSTMAVVAQNLVENMPWPEGTSVRVISTVVPPVGLLAAASAGAYFSADTFAEIDAARAAAAARVVEAAGRALAAHPLTVETSVLHGAAARELTDEAHRWKADVVVVGSHGHSALGGLLLGSVSAELVDHAPCPVLIARVPSARKAIVAVDGSTAAARVLTVLASWPVMRSLPMIVVTVVHALDHGGAASADAALRAPLDATPDRVALGLQAHATGIVDSAVAQLAAAGIAATSRVLEGHAADQIVKAATQENADLIVVGSRGLTGLTRLRLGSTARGVLHTAAASVLVVPSHVASAPEQGH